MTVIFTVANRKGGVGKTMLATNLAVALSNKGKTLLVDTDEQGSADAWNKHRTSKLYAVNVFDGLIDALEPIYQDYDFILIDVAGRDSKMLREALLICDKLVVPTQASLLDLEVIPYFYQKVQEVKKDNTDLQAYAVINKAPTNPKNNEIAEAKAYLADYPIFKLTNTVIHDRKQFREAIVESLSVTEMGAVKPKMR